MIDTRTCAVHGKARAGRYLIQDPMGRFVCMPGSECKAAGAGAGDDLRVQCSLHGKLRSLDCLEDDGSGRLVCTADRRCKTAAAVGQGEHLDPMGYGGAVGAYGHYGGQYPMQMAVQYGATPGPYANYGIYSQYGAYPMVVAAAPGVPQTGVPAWPPGAPLAIADAPPAKRAASRSRSRSSRASGSRASRGRQRRRRRGRRKEEAKKKKSSAKTRGRSKKRRKKKSSSPSHYRPSASPSISGSPPIICNKGASSSPSSSSS